MPALKALRLSLLLVIAVAVAGSAAFVCRNFPYARVADEVVRDGRCDCCDCSDEPGGDIIRFDCVMPEEDRAAATRARERVHRKTRKIPRQDVGSIVKKASEVHRDAVRGAEQKLKHVEAEEAIVHERVRKQRKREFAAALDAYAATRTTEQLLDALAALAIEASNSSSAEWIVDAVARAGVTPVDRAEGQYFGGIPASGTAQERFVAFLRALGLSKETDAATVRAAWKAALMHFWGHVMLTRTTSLPPDFAGIPHWNATAPDPLPEAATMRAHMEKVKKNEGIFQKLEQHHEGTRTPFNYGPNRSFHSLDGHCYDVPVPSKVEPGWRIDRPLEVCLYRFARYETFTSFVQDLRTTPGYPPTQVFIDKEATGAPKCKEEGGHLTLVSFVCFTEERMLFSDALSRCAVNVTIGTPLGC